MSDRAAPRSPARIRRDGNALQHETSLYLRQHAHNPLDWWPWGEEALARARAGRLPIFLSIGYASCHWCHVMEREVFENDDVAAYLNAHFVSIKVDREERPDLDAVYMDAVQGMTGAGGWPLSVFLTADAQPIYGGTYFPAPQFLDLARRVHEVYATRTGEVEEQAAAVAARLMAGPTFADEAAGGVIDAELIEAVAARAVAAFDTEWGGFTGHAKFPVPPRWQFLLHHHRRTGDERSARLLGLTLTAMASGGIYDHVGGGFHRYATDAAWLVPHFEKMLYDNALLASLYLEAGLVLQQPLLLAVARDTLAFLVREMSGPEGGFHASFDADSGGVEGSFYVWTPADFAIVAGPEDGPALAGLLGVADAGNFAGGASVLTRRADLAELAARFDRDEEEIAALFNTWRDELRDYRDRREAPTLDTKVVTAWNGLAISALAQAYGATGEPAWRIAAERAADWLEQAHRRPDGRLLRAGTDGPASGDGILEDYAFLANGLLDLYQATGNESRLRRALELIDITRRDFADPAGGCWLTAAAAEAPLGRKTELFDSVTPSGNSAFLQALLRAAALTGRHEYRDEAARTLARYAAIMEKAGLEMAWWFDAALRLNGPFYDVVVAGDPADAATRALAATVTRLLPPHVTLARVPAAGPSVELAVILPATTGKIASAGEPCAYVCEHGTCLEPVQEPDALREQLLAVWVR
jgi:hypothetical protein